MIGKSVLRLGFIGLGQAIARIFQQYPYTQNCPVGSSRRPCRGQFRREFNGEVYEHAESPYRVALIASSSWSHASLTVKHQRLYPDIAADRARLEDLRSGGFTQWNRLALSAIEETGQHEILNWMCLAGAIAELCRKGDRRLRRILSLQLDEVLRALPAGPRRLS